MTLRLTQLRCAAAALSAAGAIVAVVALTTPSARAFTMETLSNGGNSTRFADPDERVKNFGQGQGSQPFGQGGPTVQFGGGQAPGQAPYRPFGPRGYAPPPPLVGGN
jgi:hypothetical protein